MWGYISTFGTLALSSLRSGTSILKNRMQVPTSSEGRAVLIYPHIPVYVVSF